MRHQIDLVFTETVPEVVSHRQRVGDELLYLHRFRRNAGLVGDPGTPLFPPGHREIVVKASGVALRQEVLWQAAVKKEQHWTCCIFALNKHSLTRAVDFGKSLLCNAIAHRTIALSSRAGSVPWT